MAERIGSIVLAGGESRRMGVPKALLEWHGSTLLRRAVGIVGRVNGPCVVVRAADQQLPPLPARTEIVEDALEGRGPLQGIAAGLAAIGDRATIVFVSGVDAPLLHPALVDFVMRSLPYEYDVALPHAHGFPQPLAAAYRTRIAAPLHELLTRDRLATRDLLEMLHVRELDAPLMLADPTLATHDPELDSLRNVNEPDEYRAARARPAPAVTVRVPRTPDRVVRAATLATAAEAAGIPLSPASLNARRLISDPQEPLAAGDTLTFRAATS